MPKSLVLFVHGLSGSAEETWGSFPTLMRSDPEIVDKYNVAVDSYPTRKMRGLLDRTGGLDMAAEGLRTRINNSHGSYNDIGIVAHSQGGLIALRYILNCFHASEFFPVTKLITFATPYYGATLSGVASFFGVGSEQTDDLRPEADFLFRLNRDWSLFQDQETVAIKAVIAGRDRFVGPASSAGLGISYEVASSCDHISIVKPTKASDESFAIAKKFLLTQPHNHHLRQRRPSRAMKLPDRIRETLGMGWKKLEGKRFEPSNLWQPEWNGKRAYFESCYAVAVEQGLVEHWGLVSDVGRQLRDVIRNTAADPSFLPPYYLELIAYTDAIEGALKAARLIPENYAPREQDLLIDSINRLESQVGEERALLRNAVSGSSSSLMQAQIDQLQERLDQVETHLDESKAKMEKFPGDFTADPQTIHTTVYEFLAALKRGLDYLNDQRFSTALRRGAMATWYTGRRYVRAVRRIFWTFALDGLQHPVADEFEEQDRSYGLRHDPPPRITILLTNNKEDRQISYLPGSGVPFSDKFEYMGEVVSGPEMVVVPAGRGTIGAPDEEPMRNPYDGPRHTVNFSRPFAISKFPITCADWEKFVSGTGPDNFGDKYQEWVTTSHWGRTDYPMVSVSWFEAKMYTTWLSRITGQIYDLPSESQWEYAARAGTETPFWWGEQITSVEANYKGTIPYNKGQKSEFRNKILPVAYFEPNPWGLYQVHGNIWEWCDDAWHDSYVNAPTDGSARRESKDPYRVRRGGAWSTDPRYLRSGNRYSMDPSNFTNKIGFRLVRAI